MSLILETKAVQVIGLSQQYLISWTQDALLQARMTPGTVVSELINNLESSTLPPWLMSLEDGPGEIAAITALEKNLFEVAKSLAEIPTVAVGV